ncbi:MAG: TolC family protein [Pseudomonadota bacterium]|nr:TolC family protein [Pseudomonadota bacterium]
MAQERDARTLTEPGLRSFIESHSPALAQTWPPPSWSLASLTLAADYYHPDLEVARAKLAGAEAAVISAGARPNPTFTSPSSYSGRPLEFFSPWTLGFTLDVPLETGGKRGYRVAEARDLANAARLDVASTAWSIRSRVRQSLLALHAAELNQTLLTQQQAVQNQVVILLEERFKAGQSSSVEVQLVRVTAAQTVLQLYDAQTQSAQARIQLAQALGVPVGALEAVTLSFAEFDRVSLVEDTGALRREALIERSDILSALATYEASQAALQLEIAKQYPDIHLGPGYTWNQGVNNYSLDFSLTLPTFNRNQGPIAEAQAHRRQAGAEFLVIQARAIGEVDSATAAYRDAVRKLETADVLLSMARQHFQSAQDSFAAGASDRLELVQTQTELHTAELSRTMTLIETQRALGQLEDALQRPVDGTSNSPVPASLLNSNSSENLP